MRPEYTLYDGDLKVGSLGIITLPGRARLDRLWVHPLYRGQGFSRNLLGQATADADLEGVTLEGRPWGLQDVKDEQADRTLFGDQGIIPVLPVEHLQTLYRGVGFNPVEDGEGFHCWLRQPVRGDNIPVELHEGASGSEAVEKQPVDWEEAPPGRGGPGDWPDEPVRKIASEEPSPVWVPLGSFQDSLGRHYNVEWKTFSANHSHVARAVDPEVYHDPKALLEDGGEAIIHWDDRDGKTAWRGTSPSHGGVHLSMLLKNHLMDNLPNGVVRPVHSSNLTGPGRISLLSYYKKHGDPHGDILHALHPYKYDPPQLRTSAVAPIKGYLPWADLQGLTPEQSAFQRTHPIVRRSILQNLLNRGQHRRYVNLAGVHEAQSQVDRLRAQQGRPSPYAPSAWQQPIHNPAGTTLQMPRVMAAKKKQPPLGDCYRQSYRALMDAPEGWTMMHGDMLSPLDRRPGGPYPNGHAVLFDTEGNLHDPVMGAEWPDGAWQHIYNFQPGARTFTKDEAIKEILDRDGVAGPWHDTKTDYGRFGKEAVVAAYDPERGEYLYEIDHPAYPKVTSPPPSGSWWSNSRQPIFQLKENHPDYSPGILDEDDVVREGGSDGVGFEWWENPYIEDAETREHRDAISSFQHEAGIVNSKPIFDEEMGGPSGKLQKLMDNRDDVDPDPHLSDLYGDAKWHKDYDRLVGGRHGFAGGYQPELDETGGVSYHRGGQWTNTLGKRMPVAHVIKPVLAKNPDKMTDTDPRQEVQYFAVSSIPGDEGDLYRTLQQAADRPKSLANRWAHPGRGMSPMRLSEGFRAQQGRKTASDSSRLTWDEIGEMHPEIYGDPEVHGEAAEGADGQGVGWAAAHLAFDRPGHEDPDEGSWDLDFHKKMVPVDQIDYADHGVGDPRVESARRWYRSGVENVVPPVLVHRHGVYQVADGHHRGEAAHLEGLRTIPAYVAYSPHENEPFSEGDSGPYHGARIQHLGATGLTIKNYEGREGNNTHITRNEQGMIPIDWVRNMPGARGERPGEHRNAEGDEWEEFKQHVAAGTPGYSDPIFITVDYDGQPVINEGNHRRDAHVELGLTHIPAEIRYFGHAERQGTVGDRAMRRQAAVVSSIPARYVLPDDYHPELSEDDRQEQYLNDTESHPHDHFSETGIDPAWGEAGPHPGYSDEQATRILSQAGPYYHGSKTPGLTSIDWQNENAKANSATGDSGYRNFFTNDRGNAGTNGRYVYQVEPSSWEDVEPDEHGGRLGWYDGYPSLGHAAEAAENGGSVSMKAYHPLHVVGVEDAEGLTRTAAAIPDESGLKAAGIAVIALDTGRILMQQRALNPLHCPCGMGVTWDEQNGYQHDDGSISHDGEFYGQSVSDLLDQGHDVPCDCCLGQGDDIQGSECTSCDGTGVNPEPPLCGSACREEDDGDTNETGLEATAALEFDPHEGTWEFPGGKLDPGESARQAAIREFREEVGQDLPPGVFVGAWLAPGGITVSATLSKTQRGDSRLHVTSMQPGDQSYGFQDSSGHTAPSDREYNAPLHNVESMMQGFYDRPQDYSFGNDGDGESISKILAARNQPEKKIRIYRAVPHGISKIYGRQELQQMFPDANPDHLAEWVGISKDYALEHARASSCPKCGGNLQVISGVAKAKDLLNEGYPTEWGYVGDATLEHSGSNRIYKTKCPAPRPPRRVPKTNEQLEAEYDQVKHQGLAAVEQWEKDNEADRMLRLRPKRRRQGATEEPGFAELGWKPAGEGSWFRDDPQTGTRHAADHDGEEWYLTSTAPEGWEALPWQTHLHQPEVARQVQDATQYRESTHMTPAEVHAQSKVNDASFGGVGEYAPSRLGRPGYGLDPEHTVHEYVADPDHDPMRRLNSADWRNPEGWDRWEPHHVPYDRFSYGLDPVTEEWPEGSARVPSRQDVKTDVTQPLYTIKEDDEELSPGGDAMEKEWNIKDAPHPLHHEANGSESFFHGSTHPFSVGDEVSPDHSRGYWSDELGEPGPSVPAPRVFFTRDLPTASRYGELRNVYRVEPTGPYSEHPFESDTLISAHPLKIVERVEPKLARVAARKSPVFNKTASDWNKFDTNDAYRFGHIDGARGEQNEFDRLNAKMEMGLPLDQYEQDFYEGHVHGTERARENAESTHRIRQMFKEAPEYGSLEHEINIIGKGVEKESARKLPVYKGFIYLIQRESDIDLGKREIANPDDPDGDMSEQSAWWDIEHAKKNPALRSEVKKGTPWAELELWADKSVRANKEIKEAFAKLAARDPYLPDTFSDESRPAVPITIVPGSEGEFLRTKDPDHLRRRNPSGDPLFELKYPDDNGPGMYYGDLNEPICENCWLTKNDDMPQDMSHFEILGHRPMESQRYLAMVKKLAALPSGQFKTAMSDERPQLPTGLFIDEKGRLKESSFHLAMPTTDVPPKVHGVLNSGEGSLNRDVTLPSGDWIAKSPEHKNIEDIERRSSDMDDVMYFHDLAGQRADMEEFASRLGRALSNPDEEPIAPEVVRGYKSSDPGPTVYVKKYPNFHDMRDVGRGSSKDHLNTQRGKLLGYFHSVLGDGDHEEFHNMGLLGTPENHEHGAQHMTTVSIDHTRSSLPQYAEALADDDPDHTRSMTWFHEPGEPSPFAKTHFMGKNKAGWDVPKSGNPLGPGDTERVLAATETMRPWAQARGHEDWLDAAQRRVRMLGQRGSGQESMFPYRMAHERAPIMRTGASGPAQKAYPQIRQLISTGRPDLIINPESKVSGEHHDMIMESEDPAFHEESGYDPERPKIYALRHHNDQVKRAVTFLAPVTHAETGEQGWLRGGTHLPVERWKLYKDSELPIAIRGRRPKSMPGLKGDERYVRPWPRGTSMTPEQADHILAPPDQEWQEGDVPLDEEGHQLVEPRRDFITEPQGRYPWDFDWDKPGDHPLTERDDEWWRAPSSL